MAPQVRGRYRWKVGWRLCRCAFSFVLSFGSFGLGFSLSLLVVVSGTVHSFIRVCFVFSTVIRFGTYIHTHYNTNTNHHQQSHRLVDLFTSPYPDSNSNTRSEDTDTDTHAHERTKLLLIKYLALQHYTSVSHASLAHLFPLPSPSPFLTQPTSSPVIPTSSKIILTHLQTNLAYVLHPHRVCSVPSLAVVFLPGWVAGWFVPWFVGRVSGWVRVEAGGRGEEEESKAQTGYPRWDRDQYRVFIRRMSNHTCSHQVRQYRYQYQSAQFDFKLGIAR
jgi:hypothetical protein